MTFLRPGHNRTIASPAKPSPINKPRRISRLVSLFSLSAASLGGAAHAKPFKAVGVKAWTSGSQTYIRARPGAAVPIVAKVSKHTPLYVWGKYDGWYRVETHDHLFGWVFNPYINSPDLNKVREMPRSKAQEASNRSANHTMYGSPEVLKKYLAVYGAPGAAEGLQKMGIAVAGVPRRTSSKVTVAQAPKRKIKIAAAPKPRITVAATKNVAKPVARAAEPRLAAASPKIERVSLPVAVERQKPVRIVSPIPVVEAPSRVATAPQAATTTKPTPRKIVNLAARPKLQAVSNLRTTVIAPKAPVPVRSVESRRIVTAPRALTPSARLFARAASEMAEKPDNTNSGTPVSVAPRKVEVSPAPAAAKSRTVAAPRVKARAKAKKVVAKKAQRSRYTSARNTRRDQLRRNLGLSPASIPSTMIAPVSPAELLKARQDYLDSRRNRLGSAPPTDSTAPLAPVTGLAPMPPSPQNSLAPIAPTSLSDQGDLSALPLVFDGASHPLQPLMSHPHIVALSQMKPKVPTAAVADRGGSPRDRAPLNRSGSPRDRVGTGMASQALSYRGMPYIRGAASPSRGFDCSGLIYFLLRQRGYNPPRSAAGYRNWGTGVARGALQPGDLVLFANTYKRGISHIGVYLGENKFVHAATTRTGVRVSSLNEKYYASKYYGARRIK